METQNTGIRVETTQEISDNGVPGYRIIKIQALSDKDLPAMYLNGEKPVAILGTSWTGGPDTKLYLYDREKLVCIKGWDYVWPTFYTCEDMDKINNHIRAAGQHLADVNAHLRKERKSWQGKVVFVDGVVSAWTATPSESPDIPIPLAEKIAELWGEGKLLYRDGKGRIRPLKP